MQKILNLYTEDTSAIAVIDNEQLNSHLTSLANEISSCLSLANEEIACAIYYMATHR
jgi:hypothetical protein